MDELYAKIRVANKSQTSEEARHREKTQEKPDLYNIKEKTIKNAIMEYKQKLQKMHHSFIFFPNYVP